ncbi:hypothetical protein [Streptomyces sp. NPDC005970]|uniref:hypothetical protein n=1 Tax=Streptomyces sp. NPDC005970 TaxID=3156723 RepID=UPI0033D363CD
MCRTDAGAAGQDGEQVIGGAGGVHGLVGGGERAVAQGAGVAGGVQGVGLGLGPQQGKVRVGDQDLASGGGQSAAARGPQELGAGGGVAEDRVLAGEPVPGPAGRL